MNLNRLINIKATFQVVRNNMTNAKQRAISLRIGNKRKAQEILHVSRGPGHRLNCEENMFFMPLLEYYFMESDIRERGDVGF